MNAQSIPYITTTDALSALCSRLATEPYITLDTEFHRERTYYPQLCLIQIAGENECAIIDPLAEGIDLTPLKELMMAKKPQKVFHACRQDMEIFLHIFKELPPQVFDTQVAAMVLGHGDQVSYERLVTHYTKAKLDKASRFSDWIRRPLTNRQLEYAIDDVTYLRDIYKAMVTELKEKGRSRWVDEEMAELQIEETYAVNPETAWERIKIKTNKAETLAVMQSLCAWRERKAQERDQPRQRVLTDNAITEIAAQLPKTKEDLANLRGVNAEMAKSGRGDQILAAIEAGLANPNAKKLLPPKERPPSKRASSVAEILRLVLKIQCSEHDVVPRLVAENDDLIALAENDKAKIPAMKGWRYDVFGQYALEVKHGKRLIGLDKSGNISLIQVSGINKPAQDSKKSPAKKETGLSRFCRNYFGQ